jgi:hypothetical protein
MLHYLGSEVEHTMKTVFGAFMIGFGPRMHQRNFSEKYHSPNNGGQQNRRMSAFTYRTIDLFFKMRLPDANEWQISAFGVTPDSNSVESSQFQHRKSPQMNTFEEFVFSFPAIAETSNYLNHLFFINI